MRDVCFAVEVHERFNVKPSDEHEQYKWCSEVEAKEYLTWKHNLIVLEKLINKI